MALGSSNSDSVSLPQSRDNLFWWTVFLLLLAGLGIACWVGSFYVFGHPERPRPYRILTRLGKLAPPIRFAVTKAPPGEFVGAQRVFEKYSKFTSLQLERENELLFRNYLKNYAENKRLVPYLIGNYTILKTYELQSSDLISSGVVALAQSEEFPQLIVDLIYPSTSENVGALVQLLRPGLEVHLEKTLDLSAILHVGQAIDGRLHVSAMPLLYGTYAVKNGRGSFSLDPPSSINVAAGFPLVRGEEVRSVLREQIESRRKRMVSKDLQSLESGNGPQLVRVDRVEGEAQTVPTPASQPPDSRGTASAVAPTSAPLEPSAVISQDAPGVAALTAPAAEGKKVAQQSTPKSIPPSSEKGASTTAATSKALPAAHVPPVSKNSGADGGGNAGSAKPPLASSAPTGEASSKKTPPVPASSVKPDVTKAVAAPIVAAVPVSNAKNAAPNAGTAASGRAVSPPPEKAAASLSSSASTPTARPVATTGGGGETKAFVAASPTSVPTTPTGSWKTYGSGQQPGGRVVSAEQATAYADRTDAGRLYLRGQFVVTATGNGRAVLRQARTDERTPPARVIVEYPAGSIPPAQGSAIARDDGRGFEIREVRKGPDGQVNIFVREISAP